jgi:hypothetical protein
MDDFDSPNILKAVEELDAKNYLAAVELMVPLAASGNPKAQ